VRRATIAWRDVGEPSPSLRRGPLERFQAWVVTGPLGHLWSVVVDVAAFAAGAAGRRLRERVQRSEPGVGSRLKRRR
jgi:hypothetical protein